MESVPQWEVKELIRVMSFNIWHSGAPDAGSDEYAALTRQRLALNVKVIKRYQPDLIGFQEFDDGHWANYQPELGDYAAFHTHPSGGRLGNAIFWKEERFDLLRSGVLALCADPEPADAAWVHLRCRGSGHELLLLNTQLNDESEPARVESTRLILEGLAGLQPNPPLPVLLTGDYNCNAWSPIYQRLLAEGFTDTYRAAGLADTVESSTFHGVRGSGYFALEWGDQLNWRVDWILARDAGVRLITTAAAIVRDAEPPIYSSDHYPVLAELRVQP
jgi:endonuclease/exonuclease/phosphatase family metal-dependent hydrolase